MLRLKRIAIENFHENTVFLHRQSSACATLHIHAVPRIDLMAEGKTLHAVLNLVEDENLVGLDEIGLSPHSFDEFGLREGSLVTVSSPAPPESLEAVREKIQGRLLSEGEITHIVEDIAQKRYSRMELAAFLVACGAYLTSEETVYLAQAMANVGSRLRWNGDRIVDKHCVGGVPGNRTSMIVMPIVAAYGLILPKTSSRAITSPAGTADVMEVLANVDLSVEQMKEVVSRHKGCLIWGGHVNLSPADAVMISVQRPLGIDMPELMIASILSKKAAAGSKDLIIDIPVGPSAKVRSKEAARRLKTDFDYVGTKLGLNVKVLITDGSKPIGNGIGPVLEARDVMKVLRADSDAPQDLREKSLKLAGQIIEFDPSVSKGKGIDHARAILDSGQALAKFQDIIAAQGAPARTYELGQHVSQVKANKSGTVMNVDCYQISQIARAAGCPFAKGAGLYLHKSVGDRVEVGEVLYDLYAETEGELQRALTLIARQDGYRMV